MPGDYPLVVLEESLLFLVHCQANKLQMHMKYTSSSWLQTWSANLCHADYTLTEQQLLSTLQQNNCQTVRQLQTQLEAITLFSTDQYPGCSAGLQSCWQAKQGCVW